MRYIVLALDEDFEEDDLHVYVLSGKEEYEAKKDD